MKLTADWTTHLHAMREHEFERAFGAVPEKAFEAALELGAGDGFQSTLLSHRAKRLVCTGYERPPIADAPDGSVAYRACDAERLAETFPTSEFDLVFSSNLLEHVIDVGAALGGVSHVLRDDGIAVHAVPNPTWKVLTLLLHLPIVAVRRVQRETASGTPESRHPIDNPRIRRNQRSALRRALLPEPHGVSPNHRAEFRAFSTRRWRREFHNAGFDIITELKGPFFSGYGFGFDRLRAMLERAGVCSEWIYVAKKAGAVSPYETYFAPFGARPRTATGTAIRSTST